jgi:alpha-glucoside transport system substrate-binding protein
MQLHKALLACAAASALYAGSAAAQELAQPIDGDAKFNWQSYHAFADKYDLTGQTLKIFGPWVTADKEGFDKVLAYFVEATGVTLDNVGSDSFEQQIVIDVQAGSPPDIAIFPQPGLAADLAARGQLTALDDGTKQWLLDNFGAGQSWIDLSTYKDASGNPQLFAFPWKADLKSLVWYVPENFTEAGYEVPTTMEELKALTEKIVADGGTPWCIGIGSEAATGWPATDWVEDMMLRTQTPAVYDQWVKNEIPFNDPKVVAAIEEFGWFARNDAFVDGGAAAVGTTDFRDSPRGLFESPPRCYMHRQASFIPAFFPEGTELGTDANFFYFPAYADKDLGKPVLGGGTLFAITKDTPAARAFIEFLKTPIASEIAMSEWNFYTPFSGVNLAAYSSDVQRAQNQVLLDATTFRFDGSDLMPGRIGAGAFWTGMVDYVGGKDANAVATDIQSAWDAIK